MKSFHSILLVSLLLALCSCIEQPDQPEEQKSLPVTISPTLTKVTETNFDNGDAIGLSIISSTESYADNQKLTFNGSVFTGSLYWYSDQSQASTLKAYYPYSAGGATTFSVQTNQSGGLSSSDFVSAVQQNVYPSENSVPMIFKHQLTRLNIKVVNNSGNAYSNLKIENAVPRAIISASYTASGDMSASPVSIVPYKAAEDHYYAIIPPQTTSVAVSLVQNGQTASYSIPQVEYLPGHEHDMTVTIDKDKVHVTVTGTIEGWASIDNPVVYTERKVRKIYWKRTEHGAEDYETATLSYDTQGRLAEALIEYRERSISSGSMEDYSIPIKGYYGNDKLQVATLDDTEVELMEFYYNDGIIEYVEYESTRTDLQYDNEHHLLFYGDNKYVWLGNDVIKNQYKNGDKYTTWTVLYPSDYLDLDNLSAIFIADDDELPYYIISIFTDGAWPPASEHLPEASNGLRFEYTLLPDGHVREMRGYMDGEDDSCFAIKLYFTDEPESDDVGYSIVPEAVDLGLSVKWASCNLGAYKPEDYGDYYAWGETTTKENYSWETYKWCNGSENSLTKYNTDISYGKVDNKTVLEPADDVANVKLGGKWRMPTVSEVNELISTKDKASYQWEWKSLSGHNGWLVTYLANNNSIFLPAAGIRGDNNVYQVGSIGGCWSSSFYNPDDYDSPYQLAPYEVCTLAFGSDYVMMDRPGCMRYYGIPVRPVSE
ncbi:MAG: fimbrillin family protein [Bacteroidales bacterium]|nr:fimbrillin family protein [Bacteroidales bacterium]